MEKIITSVCTILVILFLFIQLPDIAISILFGLLFAGVLLILALGIYSGKKKFMIKFFPRIILLWALLLLTTNISAVRNIFTTENFEFQNGIFQFFMSQEISPKLFLELTIILIVIVITCILNHSYKSRITDGIKSIQSITSSDRLEYYSNLEGAVKFLTGNLKVLIFIFLLVILGRTVIGYSIYHKEILIAVQESIMLACRLMYLDMPMMIICTFSCSFQFTEMINDEGSWC